MKVKKRVKLKKPVLEFCKNLVKDLKESLGDNSFKEHTLEKLAEEEEKNKESMEDDMPPS